MVTVKIEELLKSLCSQGPVKLEEIIREAQAIGVEDKYAEEAIGMLASEGLVKIKKGMVTLVRPQ